MLGLLLRRGLAQVAGEPLATRIAPMVSLADFLPGWRALPHPEPAGMAAASHARGFSACTQPPWASVRQPAERAGSLPGGSACLATAGRPWAAGGLPGCSRQLSSTPDADDSPAHRPGQLGSLGLGGRDAAPASGYLSSLEDEDQPRHRMSVPLLHPKAVVTGEHHPCGPELLEFPFNAKAYYLGRDYQRLMEQLLQKVEEHGLQTDASSGNLIVCVREAAGPLDEREDFSGLPCETYIVPLDKMEAVVFFNGHGREPHLWSLLAGKELTDRYIEETRMSVIPQLDKHVCLFPDRMVLQRADLKYLRTVAFVLGQTVALHYYEMQVDRMLQSFTAMNREMRRSGSFKQIAAKEALLRMVATNNLLFADIVSKLGILERFDVAWKNNNCNDVYEHLRADMEIENRNSNLQVKLHLVSENVKYLLELMQNQRSDFLEWIIIILIAAEIMVSLFDMFHKVA